MVAVLAFELGLFFLGNTSLRLPLRMGAFVLSLIYLAKFRIAPPAERSPGSPATRWVFLAVVILAIGFLNPNGDTFLSRIASSLLYVAVLAPLIWVSTLPINRQTFRWLLILLWGFNALSVCLGVLQVEFPGRFDGATSENLEDSYIAAHSFMLANGQQIVFPKGLSDTPGGAGAAGNVTIILGTGLLLTEKRLLFRIASAIGMIVGLFCIYITQGRTNLVIVAVAEGVIVLLVTRRGLLGPAFFLATICVVVAVIGTTLAFSVGGEFTVNRWGTLTDSDPDTLYTQSHGQFLSNLLNSEIWAYPVGAGQGRWGMMNAYFGSAADSLWAEMQWQTLLYDGGILLIVVYAGLLVTIISTTYRIMRLESSNEVAIWSAVVLGYTLAAIAASFSFPFFCHAMGMELLLMNGALFRLFSIESAPYATRFAKRPRRNMKEIKSSVAVQAKKSFRGAM